MSSSLSASRFHSFAGCDLQADFGGVIISELQAVSVATMREKGGVYTFGSANARAFNRGKRGIAGNLVFTFLDRNALYYSMVDRFHASDPTSLGGYWGWQEESVQSAMDAARASAGGGSAYALPSLTEWSDKRWQQIMYTDQLLPFDITVAGESEHGSAAQFSIRGVEIMNEAFGFSTDDIINSTQNTFAAREVTPWTPVASIDGGNLTPFIGGPRSTRGDNQGAIARTRDILRRTGDILGSAGDIAGSLGL